MATTKKKIAKPKAKAKPAKAKAKAAKAKPAKTKVAPKAKPAKAKVAPKSKPPKSKPPKSKPPKSKPARAKPPAQPAPPAAAASAKHARWILLEVPYAEDAKYMHAILGYSDPARPTVQCLVKDQQPSIPAAIDALVAAGADAGIGFEQTPVLVLPLDDRMLLASKVVEEADRRRWGFSRHLPEGQYPPPLDFPYLVDTGSVEDTLDHDRVRAVLSGLYEEWERDFETGMDYLAAIRPLRHALRLCIKHFGWNDFSTAYTLRNLVGTYRATGAYDNERLSLFLLRIFDRHIKPEAWTDGEELFRTFLSQLADGCDAMGDPELGRQLRARVSPSAS